MVWASPACSWRCWMRWRSSPWQLLQPPSSQTPLIHSSWVGMHDFSCHSCCNVPVRFCGSTVRSKKETWQFTADCSSTVISLLSSLTFKNEALVLLPKSEFWDVKPHQVHFPIQYHFWVLKFLDSENLAALHTSLAWDIWLSSLIKRRTSTKYSTTWKMRSPTIPILLSL